MVKEAKSLATYLESRISYIAMPAESPSTASNSKCMDRPRVKLPPEITSSPPSSTGPLNQFFLSFPGFQYDPSLPPADSFHALREGLSRWNDFDESILSTWDEYKKDVWARYQTALTKEFNLWFGTEDEIESWYALCRAIGITPIPETRKKCREVREKYRHHIDDLDLLVKLLM